MANVDTDKIIPAKQFLKSISSGRGSARSICSPNLRYLDHGEPGHDPATRKANPDFVLNQERLSGCLGNA